MVTSKLTELLDREHIKYITIHHSPAYTAQAIAELARIPCCDLAKTVILKVDGELVMAVLPATELLDLDLVKDALKAKTVELAPEQEFEAYFPDCEVGAMPPFGNLYGFDVYVTDSLTNEEYIAFNAGTHRALVEMSYEDFARLVHPRVLHVSVAHA